MFQILYEWHWHFTSYFLSHVFGVWWFHNGSEKRIVTVHQILCKPWEKCDRDIGNDCSGVWAKKAIYRCLNGIQSRLVGHMLSIRNTHRGPLASQNPILLPKFLVCLWGSMSNHSSSCWWSGSLLWDTSRFWQLNWVCIVLPPNFDSRPEAETWWFDHHPKEYHHKYWILLRMCVLNDDQQVCKPFKIVHMMFYIIISLYLFLNLSLDSHMLNKSYNWTSNKACT